MTHRALREGYHFVSETPPKWRGFLTNYCRKIPYPPPLPPPLPTLSVAHLSHGTVDHVAVALLYQFFLSLRGLEWFRAPQAKSLKEKKGGDSTVVCVIFLSKRY